MVSNHMLSERRCHGSMGLMVMALLLIAPSLALGQKKFTWRSIVPEAVTLQYAGNIGFLSLGPTWQYGRRHNWETQLLLGFLPKEVMSDNYFCGTLKEVYIPSHIITSRFMVEPAIIGFAANSVFSGEFWYTDPWVDYYNFSTKLRFHLSLGSRLSWHMTKNSPGRRLSVYYDLSTYDLAVVSYFRSQSIGLADILALGIGIQFCFF